MKKLFFLTALLCASVMSWGIDWSSYEWLGDGAGGGAYSNKYKVAPAEGQNVVNIQQPGWAAEPGIYTNGFGGAISSCSLGDKCAIDGGGIVLYLSAFTAQETEVTVVAAEGSKTFTVYYVDGTLPGPDYTITVDNDIEGGTIAADKASAKAGATVTLTATPASGKALNVWIVKDSENADVTVTNNQFTMPSKNVTVTATFKDITAATYWGQDEFTHSDITYSAIWGITRTVDSKLIFRLEMSTVPDGFSPQVHIGSAYPGMSLVDTGVWEYTDNGPFVDGTTISGEFYLAYANGAHGISWAGYTVGASNKKPVIPTAIDNINDDVKTIKVIENGQLIIIKNGIRYNALGAQMK